ncbi:hypothetical protein HPB50_009739 [Hyalomma asiaticum]|uniref:Uncharacterized protein n=1 Tax=Hyalomma asiaticum TaxID=266040 RepID=A0ACB7TLN3_HYAAI|nr:hypothetical protein HPB50_009739 [Hyalomma asiaticum]
MMITKNDISDTVTLTLWPRDLKSLTTGILCIILTDCFGGNFSTLGQQQKGSPRDWHVCSITEVEDVVSDGREDAQQAWREAIEADDFVDFVTADDAVWVTEELDDSANVHEVKAEACPEASSSDEESDDVSLPAPIASATVKEYIATLKDLYSKGDYHNNMSSTRRT